jgi:hypothetical protein
MSGLVFFVHGLLSWWITDSRWCIGLGTSIPIVDEPWLLNGECIDDNITCAHFVHDFTVDNFMDNNSKSWNIDIVRQVFSADIESTILNTPLIN